MFLWRMILTLTALAGLAAFTAISLAQEQNEDEPGRAAAIIRAAVTARGGEAYLRIKTLVSRGDFTAYEKGVSGNPLSFVDYVVYPARERTDFGKGDDKFIQANSEIGNWIYDAAQKMIRDQKEEQVRQFRQASRCDLDNLLRAASSPQPGVKLVFAGHREIWRNTFADSVRFEYPDGGFAIVNFDRRTNLPLSVEYKTVAEQSPVNNEVRFFRWVEFGGVLFPTVQDFYREGKQTAHVSFDAFGANESIPDKLFTKPTNIKEVK